MKKLATKLTALWLGLGVNISAFAQVLPFAEEMMDDAEDQTVYEWLEDMVSNGFSLAFLLIAGIVFCVVMYNIIMSIISWRKERLELGELMNQSGIQIGMLVVVFVLLGFANSAIS
tara:strand:- start:1 stop:348 length:348 start_codon:yes stop_codon:yes gene_type:complete